jgi:tRNA A-37 threonylcarbamoyl transferase component Bud32
MTHRDNQPEEYATVSRAPWRWIVRADRRELIDSPVFRRFDEMLKGGEISPVTVSSRKTTAIAPASVAETDCDLIVKNYRIDLWYRRLRSWFRRMVGVKELRVGRELMRLGIPVSVPVAVGERRKFGMVVQCFVAVERLPRRVDLEEWALSVEPESLPSPALRARRSAVRRLGELVRKLHDAGIYQYDFNPCNFLIEPQTLELTFIDLAKVQIYKKMPRRRALDNLAKLARHREKIPLTDAMRFLKGYLGGTREKKKERFLLFREIEPLNRRLVASDVEREGRRCLTAGRNFAKLRAGAYRGIFSRAGHKLKDFDHSLLNVFVQKGIETLGKGGGRRVRGAVNFFGSEIEVEILGGTYASLVLIWKRMHMLLRAGLGGEMPLALVGYAEKGARRGFLFSVPAAAKISGRAARAMAFLDLRRPPVALENVPASLLKYARERMLERLREDGFYPPADEAGEGERWFTIRKGLGDYHVIHLALRLGEQSGRRFFRLEIGAGVADAEYSQLEWCPGRLDDGKIPFSQVLLATGWGRFRQKFFNLCARPAAWNVSARDTYYFDDAVKFELNLERAIALVKKLLPVYVENLKRAVSQNGAAHGKMPG